jgi:hypothetical protein
VSYAVQRVEDERDDRQFDELVHRLELAVARSFGLPPPAPAWLPMAIAA